MINEVSHQPWTIAEKHIRRFDPERIPGSDEELTETIINQLVDLQQERGTLEVTAHELAPSLDPEGKCSLEAVSAARRVLDSLVWDMVVDVYSKREIGGDVHPVYGPSILFPEPQ